MSELKTILISVGSWVGAMFLRKIFNDTFKNVNLDIKAIYEKLEQPLRATFIFIGLKLLYIINPKKADTLMLVMVVAAVIALYFTQKTLKDAQAQRRWDSC